MISRDGFACLASCCATARRGVGIEEGGATVRLDQRGGRTSALVARFCPRRKAGQIQQTGLFVSHNPRTALFCTVDQGQFD